MIRRWPALAAVLLGTCVALVGCGRSGESSRLVVLGLDGLDPAVVATLGAEGRLPNLSRLGREGASGRLRVDPPLLSPVIWTTIATGVPAERHGIGHFTARLADGREVPVTSSLRRAKAAWNIFSDLGKQVAVVGWWATWPAESVNGVIVSDRTCYHFLGERSADLADPHLVSPPAEAARALSRVVRPESLGATALARFVAAPAAEIARPVAFGEDLAHFRWALAAGLSYTNIGFETWERARPDLLMVYVEATDTASHLFGHLYRQKGLAGELAEQQRRFGRTVEETYVWADELVGRAIAAMDDRTTLVVLSDHGFELGKLLEDPSQARDVRRVSERHHRELGAIFLFGQGVRPGATLRDPRPIDVLPTLLTLARLPLADDLPGRPLLEGLAGVEPVPERRPTFEGRGGGSAVAIADPATDEALLEKLRSLGYLPGVARSESSEANLAGIALQERKYDEAATRYAALLAEHPEDAALEAGLASALAGLGRSDEALVRFAAALAADPLLVPAHFNRAVLLERLGRRDEAIAGYRSVLQIDSRHEGSRSALGRLGSPVTGVSAAGSNEREADTLVAQAGDRMRHGDFEGAEALLARALELAPRAAPVHQQIANVAYLKGDLSRAIAALERALELEPANALYRTNLERLRKRVASSPTPGRN